MLSAEEALADLLGGASESELDAAEAAVLSAEEALTLAFSGGASGLLLGVAVTYGYATLQGWRVIVPLAALLGGIAASLAIGAVAGLYPAIRAARVSPTEALRSA